MNTKLTPEQIMSAFYSVVEGMRQQNWSSRGSSEATVLLRFSRAIEAAAQAPLLHRIVELTALLQKVMHDPDVCNGTLTGSPPKYTPDCVSLKARIAEQAQQLVSAQAQAQENHERAERLEAELAAAKVDALVPEELAMMIRMLVSSLKRHSSYSAHPDSLTTRAMELLGKHGLLGSPLRAPAAASSDAMRKGEQPC